MSHEGPLDWIALEEAGVGGRFMELLMELPRARWGESDEYGKTLLHYACRGPNVAAVVALLQSGMVDVNARNKWGSTCAHHAASYKQPRVLEVLCATGADLRTRNEDGAAPIDDALWNVPKDETVRVLVANGVRLSAARAKFHRRFITPELEAFERGVLRCRAAVVAMIRVKRASGQLVRWDKFLLIELALCVWSTRYDKGWEIAVLEESVHVAEDPNRA